jgi:hypothetical protein
MPVARITGQGLTAIALSVALLWACFFAERSLVRDTDVKRAQALEQIRRLRRQVEQPHPARTPVLREPIQQRPALG